MNKPTFPAVIIVFLLILVVAFFGVIVIFARLVYGNYHPSSAKDLSTFVSALTTPADVLAVPAPSITVEEAVKPAGTNMFVNKEAGYVVTAPNGWNSINVGEYPGTMIFGSNGIISEIGSVTIKATVAKNNLDTIKAQKTYYDAAIKEGQSDPNISIVGYDTDNFPMHIEFVDFDQGIKVHHMQYDIFNGSRVYTISGSVSDSSWKTFSKKLNAMVISFRVIK